MARPALLTATLKMMNVITIEGDGSDKVCVHPGALETVCDLMLSSKVPPDVARVVVSVGCRLDTIAAVA